MWLFYKKVVHGKGGAVFSSSERNAMNSRFETISGRVLFLLLPFATLRAPWSQSFSLLKRVSSALCATCSFVFHVAACACIALVSTFNICVAYMSACACLALVSTFLSSACACFGLVSTFVCFARMSACACITLVSTVPARV